MNKREAVEKFVERDLNAVPQEWVKIVAEHEGDYPNLPMWGTMWIVDNFIGETCWKNSRVYAYSPDEIDLDSIKDVKERKKVKKAIEEDDWSVLENYVDEEMGSEHCVLALDGHPTALYIYEIANEWVIGVHGAGWNFYDGVWDMLYDLMGMKWHTEE